jgi:hypothetical protein
MTTDATVYKYTVPYQISQKIWRKNIFYLHLESHLQKEQVPESDPYQASDP